MSDEIFDYFRGNSTRKVEPLDESEMFEELKADDTPEVVQELEPIETAETILSEVEDSVGIESVDTIEDSSVAPLEEDELETGGDDPWAALADSLGLDPPPVAALKSKPKPDREAAPKRKSAAKSKASAKTNPEPKSDPPKIQVHQPAEPVNESKIESSAKDDLVEDFFGIDSVNEPADPAKADVLSDLFVPSVEFAAEIEVDAAQNEMDSVESEAAAEGKIDDSPDDDEDIFAAFHRPAIEPENRSDEPQESEVPELNVDEEITTAETLDSDASDDSETHVEFEIHDLDETEAEDRGRRRKRRGARRDNRDNSNNEAETQPPKRSRRDNANSDSERESAPRSRRERKPRNTDVAAKKTRSKSSEDDFDLDDEMGDSRRGRRRKAERSETSEAKTRDKSSSKPKIPTWADAITELVSRNIQRHKQGSHRGGRRRRNRD